MRPRSAGTSSSRSSTTAGATPVTRAAARVEESDRGFAGAARTTKRSTVSVFDDHDRGRDASEQSSRHRGARRSFAVGEQHAWTGASQPAGQRGNGSRRPVSGIDAEVDDEKLRRESRSARLGGRRADDDDVDSSRGDLATEHAHHPRHGSIVENVDEHRDRHGCARTLRSRLVVHAPLARPRVHKRANQTEGAVGPAATPAPPGSDPRS